MTWPKTITVVGASDMCDRFYDGPKGSDCAAGWRITDAPEMVSQEVEQWRSAYMTEAMIKFTFEEVRSMSVIEVNDKACKTNAQRAALLNLTWKALGYNVPESACKWRRSPKKRGARRA